MTTLKSDDGEIGIKQQQTTLFQKLFNIGSSAESKFIRKLDENVLHS